MGLKNKEYQARISGMLYAYKVVCEQGIEALEKELKFRNAHFVPLEYTAEKIEQIENFFKGRVMATMTPVILYVLHDTFGFGRDRMVRFVDAFTHRCEMIGTLDPLGEPYERISDYVKELEKYHVKFDLSVIGTVEEETSEVRGERCAKLGYVVDFLRRKGYLEAADALWEHSKRL